MDPSLFAVLWCVIAWVAIIVLLAGIVRSDLRSRRIPNALVIALAFVWAVLHLGLFVAGVPIGELPAVASAHGVAAWALGPLRLAGVVEGSLTALVALVVLGAVALVYERVSGKAAMGAGDVKLIGAFALFAGPSRLMVCLVVACAAALVGAAVGRGRTFPFAPALSLGFLCAMALPL